MLNKSKLLFSSKTKKSRKYKKSHKNRHKSRRYKKSRKYKKDFLFNPNDPSKSFDVYIDKNPKDTIPIKYTTIDDVKKTIRKLERLYRQKKYPHKRIWQVAMIMKVRLEQLRSKKPQQYNLSKRYYNFLKKRSKTKKESDRKKMLFKV